MGYFSNGTEGDIYQAKYCSKCAHCRDEEGCVVWSIHINYNYEQFDESDPISMLKKKVLDAFIPRKGAGNQKCTMYHPLTVWKYQP